VSDDRRMRTAVFDEVRRYFDTFHAKKAFVPGVSKVHYAGRVYDADELINAVDAVLDFNLTAGRYSEKLEAEFKTHFGCSRFLLVNSGSSANLLMVATLAAASTPDPLKTGDEVITPAVTFPTTLTPLLQYGLVPVLVDCRLGTYNADFEEIKKALSPKTRAILIPHTLGNPCDLDRIRDLCLEKGLFFLEDCCDALGGTYAGKQVGTFGDMASLSFYPAHHMTLGEGGGVIVNRAGLAKTALSIRDWGRDCWCAPGKSDTCGKRFGWKLGDLPEGYDHKYIYSNLGYNLKVTDMQAAIGLAQWAKLPGFIAKRRENFAFYRKEFEMLEEYLVLPESDPKAEPSWFGFPVTARGSIRREELTRYLESSNIETRLLFAGNILKQPGFKGIRCRQVGNLEKTDEIMNKTFFIGVYPGLTAEMRMYVLDKFKDFFKKYRVGKE